MCQQFISPTTVGCLLLYLASFNCGDHDDLFNNDKHDIEGDDYKYDHNVILGRDQSAIFDNLTPEESKSRLSVIIDQMDLDHDGKIELSELKSWIKNVFEKMLDDDVEAQWKDIVKDDRDKIDMHSYLQSGTDKHRTSLQKVEQRRWTAADLDKDNLLNRTELFRFLHPEEFKDMKPVLAQESLDELDKNNDGTVDIDEYMKDLFPAGREFKEKWIRHERQNFGISRDLNKDGVLDRDEIQNWLLPETYDRVEAEAEHIMDKAGAGDKNVLTKNEILEKYYIFVGSRHDRPYGEYLNHEDL